MVVVMVVLMHNLSKGGNENDGFAWRGFQQVGPIMTFIVERRRRVIERAYQNAMWYQFPNDVYAKKKETVKCRVQQTLGDQNACNSL